jgi:hypothetical protein
MTKYCPLNVKKWPSPNLGLQRDVTWCSEYILLPFTTCRSLYTQNSLASAQRVWTAKTLCLTTYTRRPLGPTPLHGWYIGSRSECVSRTAQSGQWSLGHCLTLESEPSYSSQALDTLPHIQISAYQCSALSC